MAESYMNSITKNTVTIDSFLGINRNPSCAANEFTQMQNMTTDCYPVLSTRPDRYVTSPKISGNTNITCSATGINEYRFYENTSGGTLCIICNVSDVSFQIPFDFFVSAVEKMMKYCYVKKSSDTKYKKYHCYAVTKTTNGEKVFIWLKFNTVIERDNAKNNLDLTVSPTMGTAITIENDSDKFDLKLVASAIQSDIAYQDGYFYYVKNGSLVRKPSEKTTEEILIDGIFDSECKIHMSGTSVVVSPSMATYYLNSGLAVAEGYDYAFYYDDVTVERPDSTKPSYKLIIKNPTGESLTTEQEEKIQIVFITKNGEKYEDLELYNGQNTDMDFETGTIEIINSPTNDLDKKRQEFATDCLDNNGAPGGNLGKGWLKKSVFSQTEPIGYITNIAPELGFGAKFATLYNNRMFACDTEGKCTYSSVIGKPYNFTTLEDGEASADWIQVVSGGQFTGIAAFGGYVYYFKEHCVHKLYGSSPSDWQLVMLPVNGVEDGADRSLAVENDICIYKSTDGFYLFDGTTSYKISGNLGRNTVFSDENKQSGEYGYRYEYSACIFKNKYYCNVIDRNNDLHTLYTYDINNGLWCAEEYITQDGFLGLIRTNRDVYGLRNSNGSLRFVSLLTGGEFETGELVADSFNWCTQSGDLAFSVANNKYISKIQIRAEGGGNSHVKVEIIADQKENKYASFEFHPTTLDSFSYSPKPIRCDNFRIFLTGTGQVKIYSITLTISTGSEIR